MTQPENGARLLGLDDEPDGNGAIVAVNYGDYREQEIWVASGTNIGCWYPLGGEFGRPKVSEDPRSYAEKNLSRDAWRRPPGTVPLHPTWSDVVRRGPVVLLTPGKADTYAAGWEAGRRRFFTQIEELKDSEDVPPGYGWRGVPDHDE